MSMTAAESLADATRTLLQLPRLTWSEDPEHPECGLTLIATGPDDQIRNDVWTCATAFGLMPTVVEPEPVHPGWQTTTAGWVAVHLPLYGFEVTVAGRLSGKDGGR